MQQLAIENILWSVERLLIASVDPSFHMHAA